MTDYYSDKLSADRLRQVYELAPPRVRRYLMAEIEFVLERIIPGDWVLELGCGYGRVLEQLTRGSAKVVGIDTSAGSLAVAKDPTGFLSKPSLLVMDAAQLGFGAKRFGLVACIQNGISAFKVDPEQLVREALRVTRSGGRVLFSSYSERFWLDRLDWFRIQAKVGLIGEIDEKATGDGVIVCKDGFKATTFGPYDFRALAASVGVPAKITEVDDSSIFCEIRVC